MAWLWVWLLVFGLLALAAWTRSPGFKGWLGELQVNLAARLRLNRDRYHLLRNVTLPSENGTTQIDHVVVSRYGIFVVETKNISGWIYGSERDRFWTQKLHPKHSQKFQNPLRQNYKHTKTLAELLGLPERCLNSVVVDLADTLE